MSDRVAAEIEIGGDVPASLVPNLIERIRAEEVLVGWNEQRFDARAAEDLLQLAREHDLAGALLLTDREVSWGEFYDLESFLFRHRIAFDRRSDAKYDYDAQLVQYRPAMKKPRMYYTTQDKQPVVAASDLRRVEKALERGQYRRALTTLRRLLGPEIPPLRPLRIVGAIGPHQTEEPTHAPVPD